jgi:hypothetical protein
VTQIRASIRDRFNIAWDEVHESQEHKATKSVSVLSTRKIKMKNSLLMLLFLLGLSCQVFSQTPATGFEGSWQGTLEAGGQKLRLVVTVTKSDAGTYTGKLESVDQGATIPIDTITVNGDAVRLEIKSPAIVFEGALNKERTELTGTFTQADQKFPLILKRSEQPAVTPTPKPKPDYSAPAARPTPLKKW